MKNLTGRTIGPYEILELYGKGGMGAVYRAYQRTLDREVAFKVITLVDDENMLRRFYREARTAASLEHPHIVPVYDFGQFEDITYVVMRLLTGGSLSERLKQRKKRHPPVLPSLKEINELLRQIAGALDYAHSRNVIHRDIKAGNVMFDNLGGAYLVDFGIAKLLTDEINLTSPESLLGTPSHIAPEQWRGEPPSPASDQYAVGIMVYEMLTGDLPFKATTTFGVMQQHLNETPTPLTKLRTDLPPAVTGVMEKVLAKNPPDRYQNVTAFADAFSEACKEFTEGASDLFTFKLDRASLVPTHPARGNFAEQLKSIDPPTTRGEAVPGTRQKKPTSEATTWTDIILKSASRNKIIFSAAAIFLLLALAVGYFVFRPEDKTVVSEPILRIEQPLSARRGPGEQYTEIAELDADINYDIQGISEDGAWYEIALADGESGWVAASEVNASGKLDGLEVIIVPTDTSTATMTPSHTSTVTPTATQTPVPTDTPTNTPRPTDTPTLTYTPTETPPPSDTPTSTNTFTHTPVPTDTPTMTPSPAPSFTDTPVSTATFTPTILPTEVAGMLETGGTMKLRGSTVFRTGPGEDFEEIMTLSEGTFAITGRVESPELWYQVNLNGQLAWVSAASLYATFKPESEEIIEAPVEVVAGGVELTYGDTIDSRLERNSETEFTFQGKAGETISIAVLAAEFDNRLELYGEGSPLPLITDDDSGGNGNALINGFQLQTDGEYRIVVRGYSASSEGTFRLLLQQGAFTTAPETGNTIAYGQTITDSMSGNEEVRYTFKGNAGDVISIVVQAGFDSYVNLLDSSGVVLAEDDDSGGNLNPLLEFYELPGNGEYTILLRGYSAASVGTYQITLLKSFTVNTVPIQPGETVTELLSPGSSVAFLFTGEENQRITLRIESDYDLQLTLRDSLGTVLAEDDDSGGNFQPLIENFRLPSDGDYIVVVTGFSDADAGTFSLTLQGE